MKKLALLMLLVMVGSTPSVRDAAAKDCTVDELGVCKFGGREKCGDNNEGRCSQRGYACLCITPTRQVQEGLIDSIYEATRAAAGFGDVSSALGTSVACSQLVALGQSIVLAVGRLSDLGDIEFGDADLLRKIDVSLVQLPTIGSDLVSCSATLPVTSLISSLLFVKSQVLGHLLDGLGPDT